MTNKLIDVINNMGNNIKQNVAIYSTVGLMALATSCNGPKSQTTIEYDGDIGKEYVFAEKTSTAHKGKVVQKYKIEMRLEDQTSIRFYDYDNDGNLDKVVIDPVDDKKRMLMKSSGPVFHAADDKYKHLRDTIPKLNLAAGRKVDDVKSASDATTIDKYFK